jgi:hypothetical protein
MKSTIRHALADGVPRLPQGPIRVGSAGGVDRRGRTYFLPPPGGLFPRPPPEGLPVVLGALGGEPPLPLLLPPLLCDPCCELDMLRLREVWTAWSYNVSNSTTAGWTMNVQTP